MKEIYCKVNETPKKLTNKKIDVILTDMPICPYCGCNHAEWYFEMTEDGRYDCARCGETFELEALRDIKFTTSKLRVI